MKVGDLVQLSSVEEVNLHRDVGWSPVEGNDWKVGVVIEVCSHHGNPPFYQVYWSPANETIEENDRSVIGLGA